MRAALEKMMHWIPDKQYIQIIYRMRMGKWLNLKNPQTFNEKLQWLKLNDRKPSYTMMVDKYEVKKYVADIIGEEYIIPTLGVWDRFEDIDFDSLPNQFVLKCTHDSGGLIIVRDKSKMDMEAAREKINKCLKINYYWHGREWPYKNVKPRIIAEKYMEGDQAGDRGLTDYKFFCFNGKPNVLYISRGLEHHPTAEISFYGMDGLERPFHRKDYKPYHNAKIPSNFEEMKEIAERLANAVGCPFIRIDLYSISGKVYFSEITFSTCNGMLPFEPISADGELGKELCLPVSK